MRLGDTEREYYLLGSAGAPRGQEDQGAKPGPASASAAGWTPDAQRDEEPGGAEPGDAEPGDPEPRGADQ
jgi:hypothetical protein